MKRRMNNFFKEDGRSFMLALDHGISFDVYPEMNNPGEIIKRAVYGGIDGILTTYGIAENYQRELGNIGLMLRIDGGYSQLATTVDTTSNIYSVKDAVRLGADGIMCMGFVGAVNEAATLRGLAQNVAEGKEWGLVVGAEMLPRGWEPAEDARTPENIRLASRIGSEFGADFIKTAYTGDTNSFREMVKHCYKPVLILGGDAKTEREMLTMIKDSLDSGGRGVVMGRNIWKYPQIDKLCLAITKIIHEDIEVEKALELLK